MQACLNQVGERSKAYYQSTYLEIPSKSVINDIMVKSVDGIKHYIFVYGQRLTNRFTFCWIEVRKLYSGWKYSPSLRSLRSTIVIYILHLQKIPCVRHCWFVSAGVLDEGSVNQALRGKQYQRVVRYIMLIGEDLIFHELRNFCLVV